MKSLSSVDLTIFCIYCLAIVVFGSSYRRRSSTPSKFTTAGSRIPGWAVGLSLFGTYLSSNTFLGIPGKAYASNWNSFVFSLSLPFAAWIATRYFVPFYRTSGEISAYTHLENRFGRWARMYAMLCYLLTQLARVGSILFGIALALAPLTGWSPVSIILVTGSLVTIYTLLGGIEAVIWTDVIQSFILIIGAIAVVVLLLSEMPEGPSQLFSIAIEHEKVSLGSAAFEFGSSTIWVVFLYGLFINLNNFGIDQSFVQRYHTARNTNEAVRAVWIAALLYIPISLLFFFIGTGLFAYYETSDTLRSDLDRQISLQENIDENELTPEQLGDHVFPHFITQRLSTGIAGLLLAALVAAAMSSVDTSLNSSATVILSDFYKVWFRPHVGEREAMAVLYGGTVLVGTLGTGAAIAMTGANSILDAWWTLSGIFTGGMLGLFALGLFSQHANRAAGLAGVSVGILVIIWMMLSSQLPSDSPFRSPLHTNMIIVVGTLTIFLIGLAISRLRLFK